MNSFKEMSKEQLIEVIECLISKERFKEEFYNRLKKTKYKED